MNIPKIERIETLPFSVTFSTSLRSGQRGFFPQANNVLVRITTDTGIIGFAEAMAFKELFGESQASIEWTVNEWIAPKITGLPVNALERVWDHLDTIAGNNTAKGAVDIALHDALAKCYGVPLYELLGGWTDRVPLTWIIGMGTVDEMVEEGREARRRGFKAFKVKVGVDPDKDVEVIRQLRAALGDDVLLYVDANQAYTLINAMRALPRMLDYGIEIVEDPIANTNAEGRAKLARMLPVPLLGDECVTTPIDTWREIQLGALGMINIKSARTGYTQSRRIIHLVEQAGWRVLMGTLLETDIGALASAHLVGGLKAFSYPSELTYFLKMHDHFLARPLDVQDGVLVLPKAPGMGIELDEEKLEKYRVRR